MASLIGKALKKGAGPPVPLGGGSPRSLPGMATPANQQQTYMRSAAQVGTVWQIVHLLASNVAKPSWRLYRKQLTDGRVRYTTSDTGSDQRTEVVRHPALNLLLSPNPFMSRYNLMEASQQHLELTGESWWVVDRTGPGRLPVSMWPVRPDRMTPVPSPDRFLAGYVYTSPSGMEKVPLQVDEVLLVKYPNPLNPYRGLGPVQAVLTEIDTDRYAAEWNRDFFLNSAEPGGVIQVDHRMDDNEFNELVDRWREAHRGLARAHRVGVLEAGATWVPYDKGSRRDLDFVNGRQLSRDLIREAWGIHKIMLGNSDDVNRANAQTGEEVFANWSVSPRLDRWREALNTQYLPMFGAAGENVEFDYLYPLPQNREQDNAELAAKSTAASVLVTAGFDPHDVLEVVGLPDMNYATTAPLPLPPQQVPSPQPGESNDDVSNAVPAGVWDAPWRELAAFNRAGAR